MIKLEAFVDDKKVAKVLHALHGLVIQLSMGPVFNATIGKSKVKEAGHPTTGREALMAFLRSKIKQKETIFKRKELVQFAAQFGIDKGRVASAIPSVQREGLIKSRKRGHYQIINKGTK